MGNGVPIKTPRGRSGPIKWYAIFPLGDFGEVTEEVSGNLGSLKGSTQAVGSPIIWSWAARLFPDHWGPGSATISKM